MSTLFSIFHSIERSLFPWLEEALEPLTEKEQRLARVVSLTNLGKNMTQYHCHGSGRKREDKFSIVKVFSSKSIYNFETTDILIEYLRGFKNLRRLCGWE